MFTLGSLPFKVSINHRRLKSPASPLPFTADLDARNLALFDEAKHSALTDIQQVGNITKRQKCLGHCFITPLYTCAIRYAANSSILVIPCQRLFKTSIDKN